MNATGGQGHTGKDGTFNQHDQLVNLHQERNRQLELCKYLEQIGRVLVRLCEEAEGKDRDGIVAP